jgi:hypothetical protein
VAQGAEIALTQEQGRKNILACWSQAIGQTADMLCRAGHTYFVRTLHQNKEIVRDKTPNLGFLAIIYKFTPRTMKQLITNRFEVLKDSFQIAEYLTWIGRLGRIKTTF